MYRLSFGILLYAVAQIDEQSVRLPLFCLVSYWHFKTMDQHATNGFETCIHNTESMMYQIDAMMANAQLTAATLTKITVAIFTLSLAMRQWLHHLLSFHTKPAKRCNTGYLK
jgi:hypothetical protein